MYTHKFQTAFLLLLLSLFGLSTLHAQQRDFTRSRVITRIDLAEKANRSVESAPNVLVNAWRMGKITGYYPNVVDAEMSWPSFARRFRIGASILDFDATDFPCCNDAPYDRTKEIELMQDLDYPAFGAVIELIEDKRMNQTASTTFWETKYVRIVWVDPQETLPDRNAVLFRYDDVQNLLNKVMVPHPKNDAAELSLSTLVENREFTGYHINVSGRGLLTLAEAQKRANQFTQKEEHLNEQ